MKRMVTMILLVLFITLTFAASALTKEEAQEILYTLEEEKLANEVYQAFFEKWAANPFSNIARSEQMHFDAILKELVTVYGLKAPDTVEKVGVFTNPELQTMYNQLIEQGSKSLAEAYKAAALFEDKDIFGLEKAIKNTEQLQVKTIYMNLLKASENHISTFEFQLRKYGIDYRAQFMSQHGSALLPQRLQQVCQPKSTANGNSNSAKANNAGNNNCQCTGNCGGNCTLCHGNGPTCGHGNGQTCGHGIGPTCGHGIGPTCPNDCTNPQDGSGNQYGQDDNGNGQGGGNGEGQGGNGNGQGGNGNGQGKGGKGK